MFKLPSRNDANFSVLIDNIKMGKVIKKRKTVVCIVYTSIHFKFEVSGFCGLRGTDRPSD